MASHFDEPDEHFDPDSESLAYSGRPRVKSPEMPVYCRVVLIIDLLLCGFRLVIVALGVVGYFVLKRQGSPLVSSVFSELATGAGIVIFGIPANLLLLLKQRWALALGAIALVFTLASIGVGIWQLSAMYQPMAENGAAHQAGFVVGGLFTFAVRAAIAVAYGVALWMYAKWSSRLAMVDSP